MMATEQIPQGIRLSELTTRISNKLGLAFPDRYWVIAEIGEMSVNRTGHCYMELVEKDPDSDMYLAKIRAVAWAGQYRSIRPRFEMETGQTLAQGIKVLMQVGISFHGIYGLSLVIYDINPAFTLGELAQARLRTIQRLKEEGIINLNRTLDVYPLFQRVALISSDSAAGYTDFCKQLDNNQYGYRFVHKLFPAIVQGNEAMVSIINALDAIYQSEEPFDAVVIVRGGGAKSDLQCFNQYELSATLAQYPIPVITGIGHDRDETVADLVSYKALKTPTAVAEYLISLMVDYETKMDTLASSALRIIVDFSRKQQEYLVECSNSLITNVGRILSSASNTINLNAHRLKSVLTRLIESNNQILENRIEKLRRAIVVRFDNETRRLENISSSQRMLDPKRILERGFSITRVNGKAVRSASQLEPGAKVEISFPDGCRTGRID